ncbi:MAG: AAA family ATPase [Gemmataceae bacterium]
MRPAMELILPELSLVLLIGPSGSGKTTFARRHFRPSEVVSSDACRAMVCDDESNQAASREAFELLHQIVRQRLLWRRFTVVDATNLQAEARKPLIELARRYHYLTCAIVFDLGNEVCQLQNQQRPDRVVPSSVVSAHSQAMSRLAAALDKEFFTRRYVLRSREEVEAARVVRVPIREDRRYECGPFDIIGDVHGCLEELLALLELLGYHVWMAPDADGVLRPQAEPPPGRKAVFVGDLVDRGPDTPGVLRLIAQMAARGHALSVLGNHDNKLLRKLRGYQVQPTHGLALTLEQLAREPAELADSLREFLETLPTHLVLDQGRLVVAHAGLREDLQGRVSPRVHSFALFGDTTGETDEAGLPIRLNWAANYHGSALVVYGHTPVAEPWWQNQSVNIDTGCVFGGRLTALRYPERETVSVPARQRYADPSRAFLNQEALDPPSPGDFI